MGSRTTVNALSNNLQAKSHMARPDKGYIVRSINLWILTQVLVNWSYKKSPKINKSNDN